MALVIDQKLWSKKAEIIEYFRKRGEECLQEVSAQFATNEYKEKASEINKSIVEIKESLISHILQKANAEKWDNEIILKTILSITYSSYVIMIDLRNTVWAYDYMAFSRRIGELWEPYCKLCFQFPLKKLELFVPPLFVDVKRMMTTEIETYIDKLTISKKQKQELKSYYRKVWAMVTSGEIKLQLDLHFIQDGKMYNIDFKSGFGSNEKGNTNRLLLVATIYKNLDPNYECMLFVRADEDTNNQYFITLKNSDVWTASCGDETYEKIHKFTGFNLKQWISDNINWKDDLLPQTIDHFRENDLVKYLLW